MASHSIERTIIECTFEGELHKFRPPENKTYFCPEGHRTKRSPSLARFVPDQEYYFVYDKGIFTVQIDETHYITTEVENVAVCSDCQLPIFDEQYQQALGIKVRKSSK